MNEDVGKRRLYVLAVLALVTACGLSGASREQAEAKVTVFHSLVDAAKFDEIYSAASSELKKSTTQGEFTELLAAVHRKLGRVQGTKNNGWRAGSFNTTAYVDLLQETQYEGGRASESFRFVMEKGVPILAGYRIDSRDLITK